MSGNTGVTKLDNASAQPQYAVRTPSKSTVIDIVPGDLISGLDSERNPAWCNVTRVGYFGVGVLYGNYTSHHFMLNQTTGDVEVHGDVGSQTVEDKYSVMTDCPLAIDESGQVFTPIDGDFCGTDMHTMPWTDYLTLYNAYFALVTKTGGFWLDKASYVDLPALIAMTGQFCVEFFKCVKSNVAADCDEFERLSLYIVDKHLVSTATSTTHEKLPNLGNSGATDGSASGEAKKATTKKDGFIVFIESIPDWVWGLFAAVVLISIIATILIRRHHKQQVDEAKAAMVANFGSVFARRGVESIFQMYDTNNDGGLSDVEMAKLMDDLDVTSKSVVRKKIIKAFDDNANGRVSFAEFESFMQNHKANRESLANVVPTSTGLLPIDEQKCDDVVTSQNQPTSSRTTTPSFRASSKIAAT